MKTINYVNLTNGIEFLPELSDYRFIYIKSTHFERHELESMTMSLSDDLLLNLALGNKCVIYDMGMYFDTPRSIWEGVHWIRYLLNRAWFDREEDHFITRWKHRGKYIGDRTILEREKHAKNYKVFFRNRYDKMDSRILARITYYKKFLESDTILIEGVSRKTEYDGDIDFYKKILREVNKNVS